MLSLLFALVSLHADPGCRLQARSEGDKIMNEMPADVVGWIVCPQSELGRLNTLFVARPEGADFVTRYDHAMVEGGLGLKVAGKAEGVVTYRSHRELDEVVHFVFEQDGLVFAYTDTPARADRYRAQFMGLKQMLDSTEWRKRLAGL